MRMPTDCEFYCVDSQIDPEDFVHSAAFNCPGIFIAKVIGYRTLLQKKIFDYQIQI